MPPRSFFLLAYDIASDRRRARIARLMESIGDRVQGSVFEAYLDENELAQVVKRSLKKMELKEDSLRIYLLCAACRSKIEVHGCGQVTPPPGLQII